MFLLRYLKTHADCLDNDEIPSVSPSYGLIVSFTLHIVYNKINFLK